MVQKKQHKAKVEDYPIPAAGQVIARAMNTRGGGLFTVTTTGTDELLVSLPMKFNKMFWIKTGNFLIIEEIINASSKVYGEIAHVLYPDQVKYIKAKGLWPKVFGNEKVEEDGNDDDSDKSEDLFVNMNHRQETSSDEESNNAS